MVLHELAGPPRGPDRAVRPRAVARLAKVAVSDFAPPPPRGGGDGKRSFSLLTPLDDDVMMIMMMMRMLGGPFVWPEAAPWTAKNCNLHIARRALKPEQIEVAAQRGPTFRFH